MRTVTQAVYQESPEQWKKISLTCHECGSQALGKLNKLGLLQCQEIYYPCGHIQFTPPELSKKRRKRRIKQTEVLFDL